MIERQIDYLTLNIKEDETKFLTDNSYETVAPIRFYKRGYRDANGIRYYFGNPNSDKCQVVISGFALLFERYNFENDASMLEYWLKRGATFSRVDLAVTEYIEDDFFTVWDVRKWYKKNEIISPFVEGGCKQITQVLPDAPDVPQTLYIGDIEKRGKRGIFRAYDKGIEQGITSKLATRIEVELKHDNADATARRVAQTNDIAGNFRAKFNVNNATFDRLMDAPIADTTRMKALPKREQDNEMASRWKWLIETVAPALKEAIEYDRKRDNLDVHLIEFLGASGINDEIKHHVKLLTERIINNYNDVTEKNVRSPFAKGE